MQSVIRRHRLVYFSAGLMLCSMLAAQAAEYDPVEIIKYRRSVMKSQREHMAAALAIIQGKVGYTNQLANHIRSLEETTGDIASLFPANSRTGDARAVDAVWTGNAEFQLRARDAQQKSAALAKTFAAGETQNYSSRLNDLLESCKSCHKDFRKEEVK